MMSEQERQLAQSVMDELSWDYGVCAIGITVSVTGHCVMLSGTVPDIEQRMRAETVSRLVSGVAAVQSQLHIGPGQSLCGQRALLRRIQTALAGLGCVDTEVIQVRIEGGWVKLSGLVGSAERRGQLVWMLQKLLGIRELIEANALSEAAVV